MVRDIWRGVGNWRVDVAHWSTGAAPDASSNVVVALGDDTLASSVTVASVAVGNQASLDVAVGGALTDSGGFYNYGASLVGGAATIGGSLYNSGQFAITAAATVSAASLKNLGSIAITGAAHGLARLDIAHAAPAALSGSFALVDDALLEFDSGGITSISATGGLTLQGAGARVSIGAGTANSALSDLSSNNGTFGLDDDVAVTTTTGLTNLHDLYVDTGANVGAGVEYLGGSRLAIGGVLTNASTGNIWIGDDDLVGSTSVTTRGLDNQGSIVLAGDEKLGTASRVALDVRGA